MTVAGCSPIILDEYPLRNRNCLPAMGTRPNCPLAATAWRPHTDRPDRRPVGPESGQL